MDVKPERTEEPAKATETSEEKVTPDAAAQSIGQYFRWRPLPWWLCFLVAIFLLTKLQVVYNDSPCAVLGIQSPVTSSELKKAFRSLSMCTHPDRLRGRLQRSPTAAESRRGEIIFGRASAAKDELTKMIKSSRQKEVMCYQGELEMAAWQLLKQVGQLISSLGVEDYIEMAWDLFWNLITFEAGIINTLLSFLWLSFVAKLVKQFLSYLWRMGILRGTLAFVTTVIIGPIPTVWNFVVLPFYRVTAWAQMILAEWRPDAADEPSAEGAAPKAAAVSKAVSEDLPSRLRQRKKKETDQEKEQRNKALLSGEDPAAANAQQEEAPRIGPMPDSAWACVCMAHKEPVKARQAAAQAMQFDLLLILTKPVIPLLMLIALGQVLSGLISSMIIGHALRKCVPQMSYEAHHLLCAFFGAVHTLLGVSASQVEDYANRQGTKVLHLAWSWSLKDVLSVMNMCQLGATVTAMSALGNEPSYAASFASGLALRIFIAQDTFQGFGFGKIAADYFQAGLKDLGVSLDAAEEVVAYSGGGIGDCGGGPFRMLFGDGPSAGWAAFVLKGWLMLIPTLSTLQWLQRTMQAGKMLGKRWKLTRFIQRLILLSLGVVQICLFANMELNASNGSLSNFWVAMLFGCAGESLLSTFDIRGAVRQIVFLLLFLFI